ncbi:MAG TPA: GNVR domain-containing protein [bacterium]|jgi:uncharacterized protein involved in exopolysaccharide biosynthesis
MPETPSHQINLLDFLAFLLRWRKFLLTAVIAVSVIVGIVAFIMKPLYRSTAVVHGTEQSSQGFGGLIASKLSELSGFAGIGSMFGAPSSEIYVQILRSRWMSERLVEKFDLRSVYKMKDAKLEDVLDAAKAHTRFELDPQSGSVIIYSEDTEPKRSQAMTQFLVDELDKRNQELRASGAQREREFIGQRLNEARATLTSLEDSLSRYQLATGVFNVNEQVKATLEAAAQLEAQRLAVQTELEMSNQVYNSQNPQVAYLRLKMASIDSTIRSLSRGKATDAQGVDVLLHLQDTPNQAMGYLRLTRDIEIQQLLVAFLIQQFEQARIEEQRNTPTFMRVDPPVVGTRKVWPQRAMMVAIGAFAAFFFGILYALANEFFRRAGTDPSHPQHESLLSVKQAWSGSRES